MQLIDLLVLVPPAQNTRQYTKDEEGVEGVKNQLPFLWQEGSVQLAMNSLHCPPPQKTDI